MATDSKESKKSECNHSYTDIANYLTSGMYPMGADKAIKRSLGKRCRYFTIYAGHLHYIGGKVKQQPRLVVQREEEQLRLIQTTHDTAHLGRDKNLSQRNERYYWPEMYIYSSLCLRKFEATIIDFAIIHCT